MMNQPLGRREVLTLAGLASFSSMSSLSEGNNWPTIEHARAVQRPLERRKELYALLGDLPDRRRPIGGSKRGEAQRDTYILETWDLDLNGIERVPAYVARPAALKGRVPGIVFNHSHGGGYKIGRQEFIDGRSYLQPVPYAQGADRSLGMSRSASTTGSSASAATPRELDMFKAHAVARARCCGE